jgi:hypothetical protein
MDGITFLEGFTFQENGLTDGAGGVGGSAALIPGTNGQSSIGCGGGMYVDAAAVDAWVRDVAFTDNHADMEPQYYGMLTPHD